MFIQVAGTIIQQMFRQTSYRLNCHYKHSRGDIALPFRHDILNMVSSILNVLTNHFLQAKVTEQLFLSRSLDQISDISVECPTTVAKSQRKPIAGAQSSICLERLLYCRCNKRLRDCSLHHYIPYPMDIATISNCCSE